MAISELTCIYFALILHDDEVMVTENKNDALIKAADVNVEPFWPGLFAKALSNVNIASLICNVGVGGPAPAAGGVDPAEGASPASTAAPAEEKKKEEAIKEASEESDDDMGFGLFD
ncbi:60S acidic ribosomal protein P1-like [Trichosurus vulpecula]|uniref:60S acidic ribosomal protein P1-like n=1 Tax=Trichosurus vulpecula TaxID=9337 RepID=UPI00186B27A3|nr:60S acidic ribosomal protein P1-like [Trichosurus vulpecula]